MKLLELFGGIGACSKALEHLEIDYEIVDYVEIDKYAVASFNAMHGTNFEPQDITKWDKDIDVDLIMHGSPCQDFSLAGRQAGGDKDSGTRSSLMYETLRIVEKLKPKYVIWENVKNIISKKHIHNFNEYIRKMNDLGYTSYYQVLNAKDYGIPQNRERVFTISIRNDLGQKFVFPEKQELKLKLKDILEDNVDEKFYLSEKMVNYVLDNNETQKGTKWEGRADNDTLNSNIAHTLSVRGAGGSQRAGVSNFIIDNFADEIKVKDVKEIVSMVSINKPKVLGGIGEKKSNGGKQWYQQDRIYDNNVAISIATSFNPYYKDNLRIRKLTPKECWRLMGFSDEDFEKAAKVNSNTQLYKQAGNSIVVNVLEAILTNLLLDPKENAAKGQTTIFDFMEGDK